MISKRNPPKTNRTNMGGWEKWAKENRGYGWLPCSRGGLN